MPGVYPIATQYLKPSVQQATAKDAQIWQVKKHVRMNSVICETWFGKVGR